MKVIIEEGTPVVARLQGRLDTAAAAEVTPDFQKLNDYAKGHLVLECKELEYISSSGLRLLLALRKQVATDGGKLQIRSISNDIRQVFMMTGFISLFEIV
jgi:anti-sigma B factor antagonist